MGQGVDQVGRDALQAQLEDLEQAHGTRADDDGVGLYDGGRLQSLSHQRGARRFT